MKHWAARSIVALLAMFGALLPVSAQILGPTNLVVGSTPVQGGVSGNYLCSSAGLILANCAPSGGGTPGGTSGQVQYNNAGAFGGFTVGGDGTLNTGTGALTVTKINGSTPGAAALLGVGAGLSSSGGNIVLGDGVGVTYNATNPSFTFTGGSVSASTPLFSGTQTWTGGGTFVLDTMNVTNTSSNAASTLINRSVGGVSQFAVTRAGNLTTAGTLVATGAITSSTAYVVAGVGFYSFSGRSQILSPADGQLLLRDSLTTSPSSLQLGVTTITNEKGALFMDKITAAGTAPGAGAAKIIIACGTNAGSAKIVAYAGTSSTGVTVLDNIGSGVTGC